MGHNRKHGIEVVRELLHNGLGLPENEAFKETPRRMFDALAQFCYGHYNGGKEEIEKLAGVKFDSNYKRMVVLKPIEVWGLCSHHLFPIAYKIAFGYLPGKKVIGLSKIPEIIKILAAKPHAQEDFTDDIVKTFKEILEPKGLGVIVWGWHDCITTRKGRDFATITSGLAGSFYKDTDTRSEFLELAKMKL